MWWPSTYQDQALCHAQRENVHKWGGCSESTPIQPYDGPWAGLFSLASRWAMAWRMPPSREFVLASSQSWHGWTKVVLCGRNVPGDRPEEGVVRRYRGASQATPGPGWATAHPVHSNPLFR